VAIAHPLPAAGPCPVCGVDEERLSIDDAVDTIRTLGRRYREAFAGLPPGVSDLRPDPAGWSMADVAMHVRDVLTRLGTELDDVLDTHRARLDAVAPTTRPDAPTKDLGAVLEGIEIGARHLATRAERTSMLAWDRVFEADGTERPARSLLELAAHEGAHHLRDLQRIRRTVAPTDDD
jgi:hypothetical protein